jgi:hypothetical protein
MTTAQRDAISSPPTGLVVFNTTTNALNYFNGTAWQDAGSSYVESDPQVGTLTASKWCAANAGGTAIDCTQDAPASSAAGSSGYVQFNASNAFAGDSALFWDNTNKRLGIGTASPGYPLEVAGKAKSAAMLLALTAGNAPTGSGASSGWVASGSDVTFTDGNVGVGTTSPGYKLDVNGQINGAGTAAIWSATRSGNVAGADKGGPNNTWTAIPGMSVSFTLARAAQVKILANGVQRATDNNSCHAGYRFVVDGTAINPSSSWGDRLQVSRDLYAWHAGWTNLQVVSLAAGSHTIATQVQTTSGYGYCYICAEHDGTLTTYDSCMMTVEAFYQ